MASQNFNNGECVVSEISAYIDGELSPADESVFEAHIAVCAACRGELNGQKLFVSAVNATMRHDEPIDIPSDFSRQITAAAESTVSGFRDPKERSKAAWICVGIIAATLILAGAEALGIFAGIAETASALFQFAFNIFTAAAVAVAVVLRSMSAVAFTLPRTEILFAIIGFFALIYAGARLLPRLRGSR
jgi:anti-sigma factor RsiW